MKLGFDGVFVVEPVGKSGGLALLWKEDIKLEIQNYTRRHINAVVNMSPGGFRGNSRVSMVTRRALSGRSPWHCLVILRVTRLPHGCAWETSMK